MPIGTVTATCAPPLVTETVDAVVGAPPADTV